MADKFMGGRSREGWPTLSRFYEREREREGERVSLAQLDPPNKNSVHVNRCAKTRTFLSRGGRRV